MSSGCREPEGTSLQELILDFPSETSEDSILEVAAAICGEGSWLEELDCAFRLHLYHPSGEAPGTQQLHDRFRRAGLEPTGIERRLISARGWASDLPSSFPPLEVGRSLVILPPDQPTRQGCRRHPLIIQPGTGFGTGRHETTRLCLEFLEDRIRGGEKVLDLGCGSGILSIAALRLGAKGAVAVEVDPMAVENCRENVARNGMSGRIEVHQCSLADVPRQDASLVLANLRFPLFLEHLGSIHRQIGDGTELIISGLLQAEGPEILHRLRDHGLELQDLREAGEWIAVRIG